MKEADLDINELMRGYCENPMLVICEVQVGVLSGEGLAAIGA